MKSKKQIQSKLNELYDFVDAHPGPVEPTIASTIFALNWVIDIQLSAAAERYARLHTAEESTSSSEIIANGI